MQPSLFFLFYFFQIQISLCPNFNSFLLMFLLGHAHCMLLYLIKGNLSSFSCCPNHGQQETGSGNHVTTTYDLL